MVQKFVKKVNRKHSWLKIIIIILGCGLVIGTGKVIMRYRVQNVTKKPHLPLTFNNLGHEPLKNIEHIARTSFFVPTPTTLEEAHEYANSVSDYLKKYDRLKLRPIVFLEPRNAKGNLDLNRYTNGAYDKALDSYFAELKTAGVTNEMMGIWVILPEGNMPIWSSVDPEIFQSVVIKTIVIKKKYFPTSQTSLMLDSQTYKSATDWSSGQYMSLLPYVKAIPKGLVDSFGLQGFPWAEPANEGSNRQFEPKTYLRADLAIEAAQKLGVNNMWLNTGTFSRMYTHDTSKMVDVTASERQVMLDEVILIAKDIKKQGFDISVHLFAEDKSSDEEGTNWSYLHGQPSNEANLTVFNTFVMNAQQAGIPLWLFSSIE